MIERTIDEDDFYFLQDKDIDFFLRKEGFKIDSRNYTFKRWIEKLIYQLWENQKQPLTSSQLNETSKKQNGLNFKKYIFCEEYLKTGRITKTCEVLNIGRTTGHRYLLDEEVQKYLKERRQEIKQESDELLQSGFKDCFSKLLDMTNDDTTTDSDKVKAIDTFLKHYENIVNEKGKFFDETEKNEQISQ